MVEWVYVSFHPTTAWTVSVCYAVPDAADSH